MKRQLESFLKIFLPIAIVVSLLWLNNTSFFIPPSGGFHVVAHRGLAQTFDVSAAAWDTNTAAMIYKPEHSSLENTISSMQAAFDYGADVVEFDVRLTKDGKLAVFHDFTLEYRTDGDGSVGEYTMDELKLLDVGYGYTADNGLTYPFRGEGIGLMPSIDEVFASFPDDEFLIHVKDDGIEASIALWSYLSEMTAERLAQISVYGGKEGMKYLRSRSRSLRLMSEDMMRSALIKYILVGFTGYTPRGLRNMQLHLPLRYARFLWGWPNRFTERMDKVGARVVITAGAGRWSEGFDTLESLESIPFGYGGYIWTNRIDRIGQ